MREFNDGLKSGELSPLGCGVVCRRGDDKEGRRYEDRHLSLVDAHKFFFSSYSSNFRLLWKVEGLTWGGGLGRGSSVKNVFSSIAGKGIHKGHRTSSLLSGS